MIGKVYEYMNHQQRYPTLWQRFVDWIKSLFTKKVNDINLRRLTCVGRSNVNDVLNRLDEEGVEPTIIRTTRKLQGWYAAVTTKENFLKVAAGHTVEYYALTVHESSLYGNPFFNVEYISSITGERDDIHKKAKQKAA